MKHLTHLQQSLPHFLGFVVLALILVPNITEGALSFGFVSGPGSYDAGGATLVYSTVYVGDPGGYASGSGGPGGACQTAAVAAGLPDNQTYHCLVEERQRYHQNSSDCTVWPDMGAPCVDGWGMEFDGSDLYVSFYTGSQPSYNTNTTYVNNECVTEVEREWPENANPGGPPGNYWGNRCWQYRHTGVANPAPTCTLTATPQSITQGSSVSLSWSTANATSASIDGGIGAVTPVASGSRSASPSATVAYTMTVTGPGGTATCPSNTITVNPAPLYPDLVADIQNISGTPGQVVTLTGTINNIGGGNTTRAFWNRFYLPSSPTNLNVQSVQLAGGGSDGVTTADYGQTYTLPSTPGSYVYSLCANDYLGSQDVYPGNEPSANNCDSATITVSAVPVAVGGTCSASPSSISTGGSATWTASPTGGNGVYTYSWSGTDSLTGSASSVSKTYSTTGAKTATVRITSNSQFVDVTCSNSVTVSAAATPSCSLSVSPSSGNAGSSRTLSWSSSNATSGTINQSVGAATPIAAGSRTVSPSTSTTYTMTLNGGQTCTATATVPPVCVADSSCAASTCSTDTCSDACGNVYQGTGSCVEQGADLIAGAITPTSQATPNVARTYSATVTNQGTLSTGNLFTNVFQRASDASGTGAISAGTVNLSTTAAGQSRIASRSISLPAGLWYLRACADNNASMSGTISETNEGNNCGPWTAVQSGAPPTATLTANPTSITSGNSSTLTYSCTNGTTADLYPTVGSVPASGGTASVSPTSSTMYTLTCYNTAGQGTATATVTVTPASGRNLTAGSITPTTATVGTPVTLTATISNTGTLSSGVTTQNIFQDQASGTVQAGSATASIAAGSSRTTTRSYTFPSAGTYFVRACADNNTSWVGTVTETNEGDNCGPYTAITVTGLSLSCNVNDTTADIGQTVTYTVSGGGNGGYQWAPSDDEGSYGSGSTATRSFSAIGTYGMVVATADKSASAFCPNVTVAGPACTDNGPITITASSLRVQQGSAVSLSWTGSNVSGVCTIAGGTGTSAVNTTSNPASCSLSGSFDTGAVNAQSTYTISCPGGQTSTVIVNVIPKFEEF